MTLVKSGQARCNRYPKISISCPTLKHHLVKICWYMHPTMSSVALLVCLPYLSKKGIVSQDTSSAQNSNYLATVIISMEMFSIQLQFMHVYLTALNTKGKKRFSNPLTPKHTMKYETLTLQITESILCILT